MRSIEPERCHCSLSTLLFVNDRIYNIVNNSHVTFSQTEIMVSFGFFFIQNSTLLDCIRMPFAIKIIWYLFLDIKNYLCTFT